MPARDLLEEGPLVDLDPVAEPRAARAGGRSRSNPA
jgi:hypothetical protein